ncbi:hypothetical protein FACS1894202_09440 [Clostridia bacterium]|nr:hypothetical protein FACS1894202_09440 [Clostridia bacterium]
MKKLTIVLHAVFLFLIGATAIRYIDLGQWKAVVALFGIVELPLAAVALTVFIAGAVRKRASGISMFFVVLFCVMQLFPLAGAFVIDSVTHVILHAAIILLGLELLFFQRQTKALAAE